MRLLAFETATKHLSVALWTDGALIERHEALPNHAAHAPLGSPP